MEIVGEKKKGDKHTIESLKRKRETRTDRSCETFHCLAVTSERIEQ